jgi:hypothetical protein
MTSLTALTILLASFFTAHAYMPIAMKTPMDSKSSLQAVSRRSAILNGAAFLGTAAFGLSSPAFALTPLETNNPIPDNEYVPSQRVKGDKLDLNSAFVGDYKRLAGFFPHAAGMIASNGPYEKVSDIYKIKGLTANDKKLFKQYEDEFVVKPVNKRQFNERINARVST